MSKRIIGAAVALIAFCCAGAFAEKEAAVRLWEGTVPYAHSEGEGHEPTITPYLPAAGTATGAAVVVCPGGGYGHLADHEGEPVAQWFAERGIAGFVLRYRIAPAYAHPAPMTDAARAIRLVRSRAAEWGVDPGRIGIMGFSAGGHLASTAGTHYGPGDPDADDPVERVSSRPDLMILVYPVITMEDDVTHKGSRRNLLGENPDEEMLDLMSNEKQVSADTPPAFLIHTTEDRPVPYENSLRFVEALRRAGVTHEFHLFEKGPHGFGMGQADPILKSWPGLLEMWLDGRGFLAAN